MVSRIDNTQGDSLCGFGLIQGDKLDDRLELQQSRCRPYYFSHFERRRFAST